MKHAAQLERLVRFYETLDQDSLRAALAGVYAPNADFKDPFNEVRGLAPIAAIFAHMFAHLEAPRFVVTTRVLQGDDAFLTWDFTFRMKRFARGPQCIRGATHLRFGADGLVEMHRDYWDAAEELYEKFPLLGLLMRWLKRSAS